MSTCQSERFMLWVDAVGGFWVCMGDEVSLGQPVRRSAIDVPILADVSSHHAVIRRDGEGYLIEAIRSVEVDDRPIRQAAPLADGNQIKLGGSVRMDFRRPHPLSATARLDIVSGHRTQPSSDAVLLMADSCILGPNPNCHVVCRDWPVEVVLYRQRDELYCRAPGTFEVDGLSREGHCRITRHSRITGDGFSITLEEV
jgi:pSer/pThr/pTyr-binding forkhead associated (FHA) protein